MRNQSNEASGRCARCGCQVLSPFDGKTVVHDVASCRGVAPADPLAAKIRHLLSHDSAGIQMSPETRRLLELAAAVQSGEKSGLDMGEADPRLGPLHLVVDKLMQE